MAEILKEWLSERLQRPIRWQADEFSYLVRDGHIIANVLLTYNVINEEKFFLIVQTPNRDMIAKNWKYLSQWLKEIDIQLTDTEISSATEGNNSTLLRLFYQLFLQLDKRDRINFIMCERKKASDLIEKIDDRFKVVELKEEKKSFADELSKPLLNEKHYIKWQEQKAEEVKNTFDFIRHKFNKLMMQLDDKNTCLNPPEAKQKVKPPFDLKDIRKFSSKFPCSFRNYSYEELLKLEEQAMERKKTFIDSKWVKNYLDNLYSKMKKKSDSQEFQNQLSKNISNSMWDMTLAEEEDHLDSELSEKVMKLCQFEKQICTQLMETKQQARNLAKARFDADNEFKEQRSQQFDRFFDSVKEQIDNEIDEIDFEKKRQNVLHKELYAEKIKRKRRHYYEICYETMLSIVDYATKFAYYKVLMDGVVPAHFITEWKRLYYKMQPIFEILTPVDEVLKKPSIASEEEDILKLDEIERQEVLNLCDFDDYHNYKEAWQLDILIPNYDPEDEERLEEKSGLTVLGHVIFTLLEMKYPYPAVCEPAKLPDFSAKAIIRGLPDRSFTVPMQKLLEYRKIHVIRLEAAIVYCLQKFKVEMVGCTDIALAFDNFIAAATEEDDKEFLKLVKAESDQINKSNESSLLLAGPNLPNSKITQTPKTLPEEQIVLSDAADLGRYAYEALAFGDSLTDNLQAAMIVEYIKAQDDIDGFVIINYPNCYREARILERLLNGREPPHDKELEIIDDIVYLEESIIKHCHKENDTLKKFRVSKLVTNPHKRNEDKPFETYFTCYMNLKHTPDILQEKMIWDLTTENSELIDRFYASLGLNYSIYYETIDKDVMIQICKYIIGDFVPTKPTESLFGSSISSLFEFSSYDDKRKKSKIIAPRVSAKDNTGKSKSLTSDIKMSEIIMKEFGQESTFDKLKEEQSQENAFKFPEFIEEIVVPKPGDEDWVYGKLHLAEIIGIALATLWEQIEKVYLSDLHRLFLAKRMQMYNLVPYTRFIKDKMEQIITMPSEKQDYVEAFQKQYNEFEHDWRDYKLSKNEWHCRIKLLQDKLRDICDKRKVLCQKQRFQLISDNWAMEEMVSMVNTYISIMQTELNRYFLTLQIFEDFYIAILKGNIPTTRATSKELTKIYREYDHSSGKKSAEDKNYRQLKATYVDMTLKDISIDSNNNPFVMVIEHNVKCALKAIKDANDACRSQISREQAEITKTQEKKKHPKDDVTKNPNNINPEEIIKHNALKCTEEWMMGVNGEMHRANLRITAIQYKCYQDIKLFNSIIFKAFMDIQNRINIYYHNEILSVEKLCKYLQLAVENGNKIQDTLKLEGDKFIIDHNILQYITPVITKEPIELKKNQAEFDFCVSQIARLCNHFRMIAPSGLILEQAFIYVVQDFIIFGKESFDGPLIPDAWKRVDPEDVPKLSQLVFGENVYIDWRDFLIFCLNIRFPTLDELLDLRKAYRCKDTENTELICHIDYLTEKLWFEDDCDPDDKFVQLRLYLIKNFLFELFATSVDTFNYPAFLLAFCKASEPEHGFTNALSMAIGKKICYNGPDCHSVVDNLIELKKYKDACLACAHKCTDDFIDTLIHKVVDYCEGTTLRDLGSGEQNYSKIIGRRTLKSKLAKKESLSARVPKTPKISVKAKKSQSAIDVKNAYLCKACEELEPMDPEKNIEKLEEEPVKEEEILQPDPNLVYTVSQEVIWKILNICVPWYFQNEWDIRYKKEILEVFKTLEKHTDTGDIFICKFLSDSHFCKFLHKVKKFTIFNLIDELCNLIK